ncbi:hypothetical protein GGI25_002013 [Coemansia spiralis]|uniref:Uncharacterized protein n=2 Tax=Coemansia TaxID=4863 RepID=A0A9W8KZF4_9FUNG|nr:hypothetical protein BX070DRAFT_227902 [Coemansia spiralis]KAJ1992680.1 hypothetical protein EDC05_002623 [Coemansia umbellata]KAJ2623269.1 hypothetical protein GGI26_002496 [Coemansia sp. RSA 1358]KAJ2678821.1 hypothetical protein GGI25_002013 [Coemansia spiralis]
MASTPLKGADLFIVRRRPALRLLAYISISLMSMINLGMIASSWSSTRFMRQNGALLGSLDTATTVLTLIVSVLFSMATFAQLKPAHASKLCKRLTKDPVEKLLCCLMATWWLAMSMNMSNMAFIYRDEIKICIKKTVPRKVRGNVSKEAMASACRVFHGSLVLNWLIWLLWAVRAWRTFTRENFHFDSTIFREPSESTMDLYASKLVVQTPGSFTPGYNKMAGHLDAAAAAQEVLSPKPQCKACVDCNPNMFRQQVVQMGSRQTFRPGAEGYGQYGGQPTRPGYEEPRVVGTATLETEPIDSPMPHVASHRQN